MIGSTTKKNQKEASSMSTSKTRKAGDIEGLVSPQSEQISKSRKTSKSVDENTKNASSSSNSPLFSSQQQESTQTQKSDEESNDDFRHPCLVYCDQCLSFVKLNLRSKNEKYPLKSHQKSEKCIQTRKLLHEMGIASEEIDLMNKIRTKCPTFRDGLKFFLKTYNREEKDLIEELSCPLREEKNRFTPQFALKCSKFISSTQLSFEKASIALKSFWKIFFNLNIKTPSPSSLKRIVLSFGEFFYPWLEKDLEHAQFTLYMDGGTAEKTFLNVHFKYFKFFSPDILNETSKQLSELENELQEIDDKKNAFEASNSVLTAPPSQTEHQNEENTPKTQIPTPDIDSSTFIDSNAEKAVEKTQILTKIDNFKRKIFLAGEPKSVMVGLQALFHEKADDLIEIINKIMKKMPKLKIQQITAIVSDNASNNNSAASKLQIDRFPCTFHVCHLLDCVLCLVLLRKTNEMNTKAAEYATLDFFKDLKIFSDVIDKDWETIKIVMICFKEFGENCFKDQNNKEKLIRKASTKFERKPRAGENTRFFSFEEFIVWVTSNKEILIKVMKYLSQIKFIPHQQSDIINKFLTNEEEIAALVDIFGFTKELLNLCYLRDGYCIEEFLPTFEDFIAKCKDTSNFASFPTLKSIAKEERTEIWIEKIKNAKKSALELAMKHYGPILQKPSLIWSKLGNKKLFKSFVEEIMKDKSDFDNFVSGNQEFFNNPTKLEDCPQVKTKWAARYGAMNVSQLVAESSVKASKRYTYTHENDQTADAVIRSFVNNSIQIEETSENLELFSKARRDELKSEIETTKAKKDETYENELIKKRIEEIQDLAEKSTPKQIPERKKSGKEVIKSIINDWMLRDNSNFHYCAGPTTKTNLNRILDKLGLIYNSEWTDDNKIDLITLLFDLAPNWFDSRFVFGGSQLPSFLDWMSLIETFRTLVDVSIVQKLVTKKEEINTLKFEKEWAESVIEIVQKTVRNKPLN